MKMDNAATLQPETKAAAAVTAPAPAASNAVFLQLGTITRLLHDSLRQLGVMPKLQVASEGLPDARSRLLYVANKTAEAATKVLNLVDQAKAEQAAMAQATRDMARAITADPVKAVASGAVFNFVQDIEERTARIDTHLTDIMLAQDFHDLTSQVVAKVVKLAGELEDSLVKLLVQVVPEEHREKVDTNTLHSALQGPVVNPEGRTDVVNNQGEVDDLLASLGF
jgi:chemotaxis protein CheZ